MSDRSHGCGKRRITIEIGPGGTVEQCFTARNERVNPGTFRLSAVPNPLFRMPEVPNESPKFAEERYGFFLKLLRSRRNFLETFTRIRNSPIDDRSEVFEKCRRLSSGWGRENLRTQKPYSWNSPEYLALNLGGLNFSFRTALPEGNIDDGIQ